MPNARVTRHVTAEDREALSELMPKAAPRWVDRDLTSFAGGMAIGLFLLFLVVSGVVTGTGHLLDIPAAAGWMNSAVPYGLVGSLAGGVGFAVHARVCEMQGIAKVRQSLSGDQVHVTTYDLVAVKCYQEPEHGGLVYLLLTDDGQVLSVFDHQSPGQDVDDEAPRGSPFRPKARVELVETLDRGRVIRETWSGAELPVPDPLPLNTSTWPEHGEIVKVAWSDCDRHFGKRVQRKRSGAAD